MPIGWTERAARVNKPRATWAAVALALVSLAVQMLNFWRSDLKPVLDATKANTVMLERIEQRLEDHETRIGELERWQRGNGVWVRVNDGESGVGQTEGEAASQNPQRRSAPRETRRNGAASRIPAELR